MHSKRMTVAATALAGALLAGCGSGNGGSGSGSGQQGSGAGGGAAPVKLSVPSAYDGGKGWDQQIDWVPKGTLAEADPVATDGESVAYLIRSGSGYAVQARDGATGKVRWTSAPFRTPPVDDSNAQWAMPTPRLTAVRQGGRAYFAAWAVGQKPGDALTESQEVTQVGIYPADASGSSVKPLHQVSVPDDRLRSDFVQVRDGGTGLLITWQSSVRKSVAVDAATGAVKRYDGDLSKVLPHCPQNCVGDTVVGATTKGPLVSGPSGGLTVPGGWTGKDIAPKGVDGAGSGTVFGVRNGMFVAYWRQADGSGDPVWSAHDMESGRLLASTKCAESDDANPGPTVTSPNGAYIASNSVVFDVKKGKGLCLAGDSAQRTLEITAVADDGTAYAVNDVYDDIDASKEISTKPAAALNVRTGSRTALPKGTMAPVATLKDGAVFIQRENGSGLRVSVRQKR
ncbi:hypothetical protein ACFZA1_34575 [Streptomyces filipinensis]|uniref:hypothetical protein n=1 Tax=Streptomyces filipinensis TaxID=66887 RepID=UPI0036EBE672